MTVKKNVKLSKDRDFNTKAPLTEVDVSKINQFIQDQGARAKVYQSGLCPNIKALGNHHDVKCKICDNGFIDKNPVQTWVLHQTQKSNKKRDVDGLWDDSSAAATFISDIEVNYFSKIELLDYTTIFFETIKRGDGEMDELKYNAVSVNWLVDQDGIDYYEGTDFKIDGNGNLVWDLKDAPPKDRIYTVHYNYNIVFRAIMAYHVNRFTNKQQKQSIKEPIQMPQEWFIKRDFLIKKVDLDDNPITQNRKFVYRENDQ